jgi:DNA-binding response OmpR family regulator
VLADQFDVSCPGSPHIAIDLLRRTTTPPQFVVAEVGLPDQLGYEICRVAKRSAVPSTVLVTTPFAKHVPEAIVAGCDGVLLKPFAPNLLLARLARLKRARFQAQAMTALALAKSYHLRQRSQDASARTIRDWPDSVCPYCSHAGATCFEFSSHRHAWFACLSCKEVWLARRREW